MRNTHTVRCLINYNSLNAIVQNSNAQTAYTQINLGFLWTLHAELQPKKQKKKPNSEEKEQAERREEGAPQGEGENGSACSFCFPLFHRGAPIDRSSAQIRQQMLELTVSFNRGKKAQKATSRAPLLHRLIPSSLCLLEAPCISPINRFNTPNMKNMH